MLISLVVPCYNEESSLPLLYTALDEVRKTLSEYRFELIFIDDGSRDGTLRALRDICAGDPGARYLSFSRNFGKEAAIYAGLQESGGDLVALMDADMQDPPALIPEMLRLLEEGGFDVVATRRVDRKGEPKIRSFFARAFYRLINKMSDVQIVDGEHVIQTDAASGRDAVLDISERQRFSKVFGWVGFKTHWLEYQNVERVAGETRVLLETLQICDRGHHRFYHRTVAPGDHHRFVVSAAAFHMLYYFIKALITRVWSSEPGYASTLVIILFLGGMILIALGILGEYMACTYMEVKNRPLYVVREKSEPDGTKRKSKRS